MQINFLEKETGSDLERIGIDFSFLSLFSNLAIEKQHKILLDYSKALRVALHTDHNPDLSAAEQEKFAELFNKLNALKDFGKFTKQLRIFNSDKSGLVSSMNEIKRQKKHFANEWKRALKQVAALQNEKNELILEIRNLKQIRSSENKDGGRA